MPKLTLSPIQTDETVTFESFWSELQISQYISDYRVDNLTDTSGKRDIIEAALQVINQLKNWQEKQTATSISEIGTITNEKSEAVWMWEKAVFSLAKYNTLNQQIDRQTSRLGQEKYEDSQNNSDNMLHQSNIAIKRLSQLGEALIYDGNDESTYLSTQNSVVALH